MGLHFPSDPFFLAPEVQIVFLSRLCWKYFSFNFIIMIANYLIAKSVLFQTSYKGNVFIFIRWVRLVHFLFK